jgi:phospholipid/cholesterol/gamma-HCH transport system substrate-binding protein
MKISNETKVGILSVTALTILIVGFKFLKGQSLFKKDRKIYAVFNDLGGLEKSNQVKINGFIIGSVSNIQKKDKDLSGFVATINLDEEVNIPVNSKAIITSPLVGSYFINIEKGDTTVYLKVGDTLGSKKDIGIIDDVKAQLTPTLSKVRNTLDSLNTVFGSVNGLINAEVKNHLQQTLANINRASSTLNGILDNSSGSITKTLKNTEELTASLKSNADDIKATVANAKKASEKFAAIDIQPTIDNLNEAIGNMKHLIAKIKTNEGTLGALMNDKKLYNKLNDAILSAEILMDDLRKNPKRYVNVSVFGRKDKTGPITSPLPKDTTYKQPE